jgi:site-specific DNA recombinase
VYYYTFMRAAIYLRQSKDAAGSGLAVARQAKDCKRLAADRGWTVTATFVENDISASSGKRRPAYEELMAAIDSGSVDVVVAWHVDRLTRRLADLEDLITRCEASGVKVATVSGDLDLSTDAGRLVGRILASVARGEVERKGARQRAQTLQAAESGAPPARPSFGFQADGSHHPTQAPALAELYRLVLAGMTIVAATKWLNDRGHVTKTGRPWERSGVRKLLLNPRNAAFRVHRGEILTRGTWEPIVPEEVWRATVDRITDPSRVTGPQTSARKWLGSGLFRCHCGSKVAVHYTRHGDRVYTCKPSGHLSRSARPIEALVERVVVARLRRPDLAELLIPDRSDEVARLRMEASDLRLRLEQMATDYGDGLLSARQLQVASQHVEAQLGSAEEAMADAARETRLGPVLGAADPGEAWLDADLSTRQAVVDVLARVTLLPGQRGRAPFRPDSVRFEWRG